MRLLDATTAFFVFTATAGTLFFIVLAFSAQTPLQAQTLTYLERGGELPYTPEAQAHMQDVRNVLNGARVFTAAALLVALLLLSHSAKSLYAAGLAAITLPPAAALLPWDALFSGMHAVLFPQGNWRFPANSLLIQTYPRGYFQGFAIAWGALMIGAGLVFVVLGRSDRKRRE